MPRGYELEDFLTPRDVSEGREPTSAQSSRDQVAREQAADDRSPVAARNHDRNAAPPVEPRSIHEIRGRTYRLGNSETATMVELGKFRAIAREDLAEFAYGGDTGRMRPDIENLMRQGLVAMKAIPHEEMGSRKLLTLTKNGHRFLTETQSAGKGQVLYSGFTKPREADLYRLYQKAAEMIEEQGGRNLRVVLDYEMKKRLYRDLAKLGPGRASPGKNILLPNGMVFGSFEERFQFPTFGSNTKRATARGPVCTSNSPPVITGEEIWRKKSAPASPSMPTRKMPRNSGAFWISVN
jgi:hypothetical protein